MRDVFMVGTGGLARETARIVKALGIKGRVGKFSGFISSSDEEIGRVFPDGVVVGSDHKLPFYGEDVDLVIAIGYPKLKSKVFNFYKGKSNIYYPNIIDERAFIDDGNFSIGIGNIITCGVFISCNVSIGDFCLVNWNSTIGHDVVLGSFAVVNPGVNISGYVRTGENVLIGAGAVILENRLIGNNSSVGAGAVVTRDVEENRVVVGIPAKERV